MLESFFFSLISPGAREQGNEREREKKGGAGWEGRVSSRVSGNRPLVAGWRSRGEAGRKVAVERRRV